MHAYLQQGNNLGLIEKNGNLHRALKHFVLAANAGHEEALEGVKIGYKHGFVTKDEYAQTYEYEHTKYQKRQDEVNSNPKPSISYEMVTYI